MCSTGWAMKYEGITLKWLMSVWLVFSHITDCSIVLNPFTPSGDQIGISPNSSNEVLGKRLLRRKKHVD